MHEIDENGIRIYPLPDCDSDEDEDYKEQVKQLKVSNIIVSNSLNLVFNFWEVGGGGGWNLTV